MISITKFLLEQQIDPRAYAAMMATPQGQAAARQVAADKAAGTVVAAAPVKKIINPATVKIPVAGQVDPNYRQDLRATLNRLPQRQNMNYAGKVPLARVNPTDQTVVDNTFKQVRAERLAPAGVPAAPPAAPQRIIQTVSPAATQVPAEQVPVAANAAQQQIANAAATPAKEIGGAEAAGIALKKGAQATGEALGSGAKKAMEFAGENPVAGGVVAGALGALGLRKLIKRNKE
jgi:anthranilate phosphoribosyltransferase